MMTQIPLVVYVDVDDTRDDYRTHFTHAAVK